MSDEPKKPDDQSMLPGLKPWMPRAPQDWRKWTDGRGNKIDAPARRGGGSFGGKTVMPLVGSDGQPIRLGDLQVIQNVRGVFVVIDHSLPMFEIPRPRAEDGGAPDDTPHTSPIMGREVFATREGLGRAMAAMVVLHRDKLAEKARLPLDPAQCIDTKGREIRRGDLALCRYTRGPTAGKFAVVDHGFSPRRIYDLEDKNIKAALRAFEKRCARHRPAAPKRRPHAGLIGFEPPPGWGGGGGGWMRAERSLPEPGSVSWKTIVASYAQTGKWCRTANMIWGDVRPEEIERQAEEARKEWLTATASTEETHRKDDPAALKAMKRLREEDKTLVNMILEQFDGVLTEVKLP